MSVPFDVLSCIAFWSLHRPDAMAVSCGTRTLTYRNLAAVIRREAVALGNADGAPCRIAILATDKLDTIVGVLSASAAGGCAVVLNPGIQAEALTECLADVEPNFVLLANGDSSLWSTITARSPQFAALPIHMISTETPHSSAAVLSTSVVGPDDWCILYSSGSTGTPKGIERDTYSMHTEFLGWCLELGLSIDDSFFVARPTYYTGGLVLAMSSLLAGGRLVLATDDTSSAEVLVREIEQASSERPLDWLFLVPDQVRSIGSGDRARLRGRVRAILVMGAPISAREKTDLAFDLDCRVIESWGNSESLGTITDDEMLRECPASVGRPFLGDSMCVVDQQGRVLPPREIGFLAGGEEAGFTRYTNRPAETLAARRDGLIVSEDVGWADERSRFYVLGRVQEAVVRDRETYFLPKIEGILRDAGLTHPICLARLAGPESPIGLLVQASADDTSVRVRQTLASVKGIPDIAEVRYVSSLPRTPSGKLDRQSAARAIWSER